MEREQGDQWQPTATKAALVARAQLLANIRSFFAERDVLEVETPILSQSGAIAPHLENMVVSYHTPSSKSQQLFLQTSPEYAMKRLLASSIGSIYQITKAFRNGEVGRYHNPEFSLLEWYRIDFDHFNLMNEVDSLLALILRTFTSTKISYQELFDHYFRIDIFTIPDKFLAQLATDYGFYHTEVNNILPRQIYLDFLLSTVIEPNLGHECPYFIYHYPASEAQLARICPISSTNSTLIAARFEVYYQGIELANGYHELSNHKEQLQRFKENLTYRKEHGLAEIPIDKRILAALACGLPNCAGVALGIDRLLMLQLGSYHIKEVLTFPIDIA
ncbi:elongation factor P--(R)-beta-lysine ligase [Candidatus Nitrosacidococcus tergens]|uniref:Elongation factor P--(R)-beta-lysine ligase n=1 Tax=Candidatus Nitrosacidococcus tergens TaxID=553981 RepID=A0A7G1QB04_9GAMM|nr:elongation factor P--(R)-beta-lysine ligase [Candidatus Nitrosacidococcus tergens]CAB1277055.1 Elongation factor P--(R)-beta-lysine ligase [Candidatus Nitrosacidococcus tergens]